MISSTEDCVSASYVAISAFFPRFSDAVKDRRGNRSFSGTRTSELSSFVVSRNLKNYSLAIMRAINRFRYHREEESTKSEGLNI